jgi:hypothetical protein
MKKQMQTWMFGMVAASLLVSLFLVGCSDSQANSPSAAVQTAVTATVAPAPAEVAAPASVPAGQLASAPAAVTETASNGGAPGQEGIKVHGHWVIDVTNPDGALASHNEFENELTTSGSLLLADILTRQNSVGGWKIVLYNSFLSSNSFLDSDGNVAAGSILESTYPYTGPNYFKTLTVSVPSQSHQVELKGNATAGRDGSIEIVYTSNWLLSPAIAPTSSYQGTECSFTQKILSPQINLQAGQQVTVTVTISFS